MSPTPPTQIVVNSVTLELTDPDNSIAAETFCALGYEPAVCTLLSRIVRRSTDEETFLDIGAHYGFFPVLLAQIAPHVKVHAIEPGREQVLVLRDNVRLYALNTTVHEIAFSDAYGTQRFLGRKFVKPDVESSYDVQAWRGDDFLDERGIHPQIAKIDVHGLEVKVLRGMQACLQNDIEHLFTGDPR